MADNTCTICNKDFQSQSHLRRHQNGKRKCKNKDDVIKTKPMKYLEFFRANIINDPEFTKEALLLYRATLDDKEQNMNEVEIANSQIIKCNDCGLSFAHTQSLHRHVKLNRCSGKKNKQDSEEDDDFYNASDIEDPKINNEIININAATNPVIENNKIENSNVTVDASNHIDNSKVINNNITINVNPFGLESLEHITLKDFKYIFSDTESLMNKLCNLVFNKHLSNISFYKYNLNKKIITFLSKNMEIERIKEQDFIMQFKRLLEDTCILLFYQYREQLNLDELIKYMKRLVEYQDMIMCDTNTSLNEKTKDCIIYLMDFAFRNKEIKYSIDKTISDLKNNKDLKNQLLEQINNEDDKRNGIINEYNYRGRDKKDSSESDASNRLLYKLRNKVKEEIKKDDKEKNKINLDNVFENVNFNDDDD